MEPALPIPVSVRRVTHSQSAVREALASVPLLSTILASAWTGKPRAVVLRAATPVPIVLLDQYALLARAAAEMSVSQRIVVEGSRTRRGSLCWVETGLMEPSLLHRYGQFNRGFVLYPDIVFPSKYILTITNYHQSSFRRRKPQLRVCFSIYGIGEETFAQLTLKSNSMISGLVHANTFHSYLEASTLVLKQICLTFILFTPFPGLPGVSMF
jgi:hypothetical protein